MNLGLQGKVAVITGGTAGIGKALIRAFLAEGCLVATCGRNAQMIAKTQAEFPSVLVLQADVSNGRDLRRLAEETEKTFGGIDIWVNNAGINIRRRLTDMTEDEWDTIMNVNLKSVFLSAGIAAPCLKRRGGGVIINASSLAALIPIVYSGAYAASKAAINALTCVLAAELAPDRIRVVSYLPGMFDTDMNKESIAARGEQLLNPIALHRFGLPDEIAPAVVFLASDKASYITGTGVPVTGGKFCVQNAEIVHIC